MDKLSSNPRRVLLVRCWSDQCEIVVNGIAVDVGGATEAAIAVLQVSNRSSWSLAHHALGC